MGSSRIWSLVVLLGLAAAPVSAQLSPANATGVAMGHLHYYVRDIDANQRFWESLGGESTSLGQSVVVTFPDVLVFLTQGEPRGGTEGSIVNHVAFRVQSLDTVAAAGLEFDPCAVRRRERVLPGRRADRAIRQHGDEPDVHAGAR